jgi:hypothetical protein
MPLGTFVSDVTEILREASDVDEVLVRQVHRHRFAAEMGREGYAAFFRQYNEARESVPAGRLVSPSRREPTDSSRG